MTQEVTFKELISIKLILTFKTSHLYRLKGIFWHKVHMMHQVKDEISNFLFSNVMKVVMNALNLTQLVNLAFVTNAKKIIRC